MDHSLISALLAGLGGLLGWGLADLFAKKTIDEIGDTTTLVLAHLFGTASVVSIALYEVIGHRRQMTVPHAPATWLYLAFFGTLQAVIYLLVYRGFGKGQVGVLNPIFSSFSGLTAVLSVGLFGEVLKRSIVVALVIIFVGIMLINIDLRAFRERRLAFLRVPGFPEIAVATLLAALWTLGWDQFVSGVDWLSYALWMYVFMTLALLAYAWVKGISLRVRRPSIWKYLAVIGFFETGAYIAVSWGYGVTSLTSVVAVLSGAFSLPTIIGARLWLRERTTPLQLVGSLAIVLGVCLVSLF